MKLRAAVTLVLGVSLAALAGAQVTTNSSGAKAATGSISRAPAVVANPDYEIVTSHLDQGGSFYLYADVENLLMGIVDKLEPLFAATADKDLKQLPILAREMLATSGLTDISDFGVSAAPVEGGLRRVKSYMRVKGRTGLLRLAPAAEGKFDGAEFLSREAGAAGIVRINLEPVLEIAENLAHDVKGAEGRAAVREVITNLRLKQGIDVPLLLNSLQDEWGIAFFADEERQVALPFGGKETLKVPHPGMLVLVEVKNRAIYDLLVGKLREGKAPIQDAKLAGVDVAVSLPIPTSPFSFTPTLAQAGNWLFLASSPELISGALSKKGDFRSTPEFAQLAAGLPVDRATGISYFSPKLLQQVKRVSQDLQQALQSNNAPGEARTGMELMTNALGLGRSTKGQVRVSLSDENGFWTISQGDLPGGEAMQSLSAVPVVAILAAIAVPNFLEAQVRAKVSRTRNDMRSMATAIETYYVDNNVYPSYAAEPEQKMGRAPQTAGVPSFRGSQLTTPIAYMTSFFVDPFAEPEATFAYYAPEQSEDKGSGWILFSPGPDSKYDLDWKLYNPSLSDPTQPLIPFTYDPTNGTASPGDIWRIKQ